MSEDRPSDETEDQPVRENNRYALTPHLIISEFNIDFGQNAYIHCSEFHFEMHTVVFSYCSSSVT